MDVDIVSKTVYRLVNCSTYLDAAEKSPKKTLKKSLTAEMWQCHRPHEIREMEKAFFF